MKEKEKYIIAEWLEGNLSNDTLRHHYDDSIAKDLTTIIKHTEALSIPPMDSTSVKSRIDQELDGQSYTPKTVVFQLKYWVTAIAAIFLACLAYVATLDSSLHIASEGQVISVHTLPDGSSVTLNKYSTISYEEDFAEERVLTLEGEAFFEVKKGSSFVVKTHHGEVEVLGTSFNVFARGDYLSVDCKTGKVAVTTSGRHLLTPGDRLQYQEDQDPRLLTIDQSVMASWIGGSSIYQSSMIGEVIEAISAQYGYTVQYDGTLPSDPFTGSFVHDNIDKALRMVLIPMGISYEYSPKKKIIYIL